MTNSTLGALNAVTTSQISGQLYVAIAFEMANVSSSNQATILDVMISMNPIAGPFQQEVDDLEDDIEHLTVREIRFIYFFFERNVYALNTGIEQRSQASYTTPCNDVISHGSQIEHIGLYCQQYMCRIKSKQKSST